ncbi:MAG TPA: hypothetical protein PLY01_08575 [Caldisericia bacterium]|nr:hypothetical protein [Caldisericia bacterium]
MSRPKGSNKIRFAKRVVRSWLMYKDGYQVERIAFDLGVTPRMVYYYLNAWSKNKNYFIKIAQDAGAIPLRDAGMLPTNEGYKDILPAKILR